MSPKKVLRQGQSTGHHLSRQKDPEYKIWWGITVSRETKVDRGPVHCESGWGTKHHTTGSIAHTGMAQTMHGSTWWPMASTKQKQSWPSIGPGQISSYQGWYLTWSFRLLRWMGNITFSRLSEHQQFRGLLSQQMPKVSWQIKKGPEVITYSWGIRQWTSGESSLEDDYGDTSGD